MLNRLNPAYFCILIPVAFISGHNFSPGAETDGEGTPTDDKHDQPLLFTGSRKPSEATRNERLAMLWTQLAELSRANQQNRMRAATAWLNHNFDPAKESTSTSRGIDKKIEKLVQQAIAAESPSTAP